MRARRVHLRCQGVRTCEYVSEELFGDCERYEPDEAAMRDLWNHELDANEREAASAGLILSRCGYISQRAFKLIFADFISVS